MMKIKEIMNIDKVDLKNREEMRVTIEIMERRITREKLMELDCKY